MKYFMIYDFIVLSATIGLFLLVILLQKPGDFDKSGDFVRGLFIHLVRFSLPKCAMDY
jgi:hypothetical protein